MILKHVRVGDKFNLTNGSQIEVEEVEDQTFVARDLTDQEFYSWDKNGLFLGYEDEPGFARHIKFSEQAMCEPSTSEPDQQTFKLICLAVAPAFAAKFGSSDPRSASQETVKFAKALLEEMKNAF